MGDPKDSDKAAIGINMIRESESSLRDLRRTRRAIWAGAIALAAAISLMIVLQDNEVDSGIQTKGDLGTTRIYVEQSGKVQEFKSDVLVTEGAKVRVQIIALQDLLAVLILLDDKHPLDAASAKAAPQMQLKAGETAGFPGSLELYGANDHETVLTVLCPAGIDASSHLVSWTESINQRHAPNDDKSCQFNYVKLR